MPPYRSDNFNRPNAPNLGPNWQVPNWVIQPVNPIPIVNNQIAVMDLPLSPYRAELYSEGIWSNNQSSKISIIYPYYDLMACDMPRIQVLGRASLNSFTCYLATLDNYISVGRNMWVYLYKIIDGISTFLASAGTGDFLPGDTFEIRCIGSTISVLYQDFPHISITDTEIMSGFPGIRIGSVGTCPPTIVDNWEGWTENWPSPAPCRRDNSLYPFTPGDIEITDSAKGFIQRDRSNPLVRKRMLVTNNVLSVETV